MLLEGRTAVISGAASRRGIGLATAKLFAAHGARVAILDIDAAAAATAAAELGAGHVGIGCDVADKASCDAAAAAVLAAFGHVDILINNAGVTQPVKIMEIDEASWDRILDINTKGVLFLSQAFIPHMRERKKGSIACMSSVSAQRGGGIFGGSNYSAAKAGVLGLAKAMARELGPDGIRVNCVTPGVIRTPMNAELSDDDLAALADETPLGRIGEPEECAEAILFLASEKASFITGQVLGVSGGLII